VPRFIAERPDVMGRMERDQEAARNANLAEDEVLQGLVDKYHPSDRELRRIRNPMGNFLTVPGNERMLLSHQTTKKEINRYNRAQRWVQEIGSKLEEWHVLDGIRRVWVKVLLMGEDAKAARVRNNRMITGAQEKDGRLSDAIRNTAKRKKAANAARVRFEAAIRSGRRRGNAGIS
jgi:hypothetical protein